MCCYLLGQFRVYNRSSVARNWGELRATVIELHGIVGIAWNCGNCAELCGIAWNCAEFTGFAIARK